MLAAEPYPGAVEAVRAWHEAGHFIHITSHRADGVARRHRALAAQHRPARTTSSTAPTTRSPAAEEIGIDVLIDDSPVNLERALDAGITAATLLHPGTASCARPRTSSAGATGTSWRANLAPVLA